MGWLEVREEKGVACSQGLQEAFAAVWIMLVIEPSPALSIRSIALVTLGRFGYIESK